jgi:Flp pilus assembly pilin Flp
VTNLVVRMQNAWFNLRDAEQGQTMAEYALVLALIVAVTAAVFTGLGGRIRQALTDVTGQFGGGA